MKKLYLPLILLVALCFSSCVDIEEHYDFKSDGTCKVAYAFDMSRAVSVLVNLMSDSVKETPQFSLVKDTTLNFYTAIPDSAQQKLNLRNFHSSVWPTPGPPRTGLRSWGG